MSEPLDPAEHEQPEETPTPQESEIDRLAAQVAGPEDRVGMATLWRVTMSQPHWWFIAVGEPGLESPAAAEVDGTLMLLTFTDSERARHFAVAQEMIGPEDDLQAIALPPREVVDSAEAYRQADIAGLMFDPHISGFYMPADQMVAVWEAVMAAEAETTQDEGPTDTTSWSSDPASWHGEPGPEER